MVSGVISSGIRQIRRHFVNARRGLDFLVGLKCEGRGLEESSMNQW